MRVRLSELRKTIQAALREIKLGVAQPNPHGSYFSQKPDDEAQSVRFPTRKQLGRSARKVFHPDASAFFANNRRKNMGDWSAVEPDPLFGDWDSINVAKDMGMLENAYVEEPGQNTSVEALKAHFYDTFDYNVIPVLLDAMLEESGELAGHAEMLAFMLKFVGVKVSSVETHRSDTAVLRVRDFSEFDVENAFSPLGISETTRWPKDNTIEYHGRGLRVLVYFSQNKIVMIFEGSQD